MSESMIEQVKAAIVEAIRSTNIVGPSSAYIEPYGEGGLTEIDVCCDLNAVARAAIEAIREPIGTDLTVNMTEVRLEESHAWQQILGHK